MSPVALPRLLTWKEFEYCGNGNAVQNDISSHMLATHLEGFSTVATGVPCRMTLSQHVTCDNHDLIYLEKMNVSIPIKIDITRVLLFRYVHPVDHSVAGLQILQKSGESGCKCLKSREMK